MRDAPTGRGVWWNRVLWLVVIWTASVAVLGVVAYAMRWVMRVMGMTV